MMKAAQSFQHFSAPSWLKGRLRNWKQAHRGSLLDRSRPRRSATIYRSGVARMRDALFDDRRLGDIDTELFEFLTDLTEQGELRN